MPQPRIPPREYQGVLNIDRDQENANLKEVMQDYADDYKDFVCKFLKDPPSPLVPLPKRQQWQKFQSLILEAYGGDVIRAEVEQMLLLAEPYVDYLRRGILPLPESRPWRDMVLVVPDEQGMPVVQGAWFLMEEVLQEYRALNKEFGSGPDRL